MSGLLKTTQSHDLHEIADMEARRRTIESDIGGDAFLLHQGVECLSIRALMKLAAGRDKLEEFGAELGHAVTPCAFPAFHEADGTIVGCLTRCRKSSKSSAGERNLARQRRRRPARHRWRIRGAARCGSDACHAAWTRAKCEGLPLSLPSTIGMLYPMPGGRLHLPTA